MGRGERRFSQASKEALLEYGWPGNIRELENSVQRAMALSDGDEIQVKDLFDSSTQAPETRSGVRIRAIPDDGIDLEKELSDIEVVYLRKALDRSRGNYTKAAQVLRMSLRSFRYKMQKYGLDKVNP